MYIANAMSEWLDNSIVNIRSFNNKLPDSQYFFVFNLTSLDEFRRARKSW